MATMVGNAILHLAGQTARYAVDEVVGTNNYCIRIGKKRALRNTQNSPQASLTELQWLTRLLNIGRVLHEN